MTQIEVAANRAMYRWAITRDRLDPADVDERFPNLRAWESGDASPTLRELERFAAATHTPVGYFFLPDPPREQLPIADFRTPADRPMGQPSSDLLETIYVCQQRQEWFAEYIRSAGGEALPFVGSVTQGANVERTAADIRDLMGFDLDERAALPNWSVALRRFIELVDDAGVLVMVSGIVRSDTHRTLDPGEFRGFTIVEPFAPLIFVNGADTKAGQMFTLAHELAHVWAGQSAVSNAQPSDFDPVAAERWCNAIAAELLVPLAALRASYRANSPIEDEMQRLAGQFKVSTLVVLRRIHDLGAMNREQFWERYHAEVERIEELPGRQSTGGNFYNTEVLRVGRRFASALVVSTLAGQTPYRDAFRMLGVSSTETLERFGRHLGVQG